MGENSKIEWCHHTFNPWRGCTKVSPGCEHCYAERETKRWGLDFWGPKAERPRTSVSYWRQPIRWNQEARIAGERRRVFCASFADVGEDRDDLIEARRDLQVLIEATPDLDWLLLTKRPENMVRLFARWQSAWPSNVWVGASVENQEQAGKRIAQLVQIPARVRFLSCEPLVGPVNLGLIGTTPKAWGFGYQLVRDLIHWVIVGGESGPQARPMAAKWALDLLEECKLAGTEFHFKQWGEWDERGVKVGKKEAGRLLAGRTFDQFPV